MAYPHEWEEDNRHQLRKLYDILINNIKVPYPYSYFVDIVYNNKTRSRNKNRVGRGFVLPPPVPYV